MREPSLILPSKYLQVVGVSPGSCAVLEMEFPVPETIKLVDHALSRYVHKGLLAVIEVEGEPEPRHLQSPACVTYGRFHRFGG